MMPKEPAMVKTEPGNTFSFKDGIPGMKICWESRERKRSYFGYNLLFIVFTIFDISLRHYKNSGLSCLGKELFRT